MTALPFIIVPDHEDNDLLHTACPHCGGIDTVVEVDRAVRFNRLTNITPTGAVASLGDSGDFDFEEWFCTKCNSNDIHEPEGFEIKDWY